MNSANKRTFSQFQATEDQEHVDALESGPKPKKQKINPQSSNEARLSTIPTPLTPNERSPSLEILSVKLPEINVPQTEPETIPNNDNKENKGDTNNSTSDNSDIHTINDTEWINNDDCSITQHELQNDWYHFKVIRNSNTAQFKWLKHHDLLHLNVYEQYLTTHNLSLSDVTEPQFHPERIIDHQYNEETDNIDFCVKWKGYPDHLNSWEPHEHLQNNDIYIEYCKKHHIITLLTEHDDDDDDNDEEYEVIEEEEKEEEPQHSASDDTTVTDIEDIFDIEDIIDVEMEYTASQKQQKTFSMQQIEDILIIIDGKRENMYKECDDIKETEINKWLDIRQHFETLKANLIFKAFRLNEFMKDSTPNNDDDDDVQIIDHINNHNNNDKQRKKPDTKKQRKTLFDYAFIQRKPVLKSKPRRSNNKLAQNKAKKPQKRKKSTIDSNIFNLLGHCNDNNNKEEDEIPEEYLLAKSTCYGCKRKWPLHGVEFFKYYPICNKCPKHIRLGHNRKFKEDWFCPYCIHCAHCTFTKDGHQNEMVLSSICNAKDKPYLYVKPNDSNYWKTYIPLNVVNTETKELIVRGKRKSQIKQITLSDIANHRILWAFHDKTENIHLNMDIDKIVSMNHRSGTVTFKVPKKKTKLTVPRGAVIHCSEYLNKFMLETIKKCKSERITFDRKKVFKHSRRIKTERKEKEREKHRLGANTKITESAPTNSRYFNEENEESKMIEDIPNHSQTVQQLLSAFNLESVPNDFVEPPRRRVLLEDIMKYSLVLIVGPSGSGKSTLLRDLRFQNPSKVTFKSPECLKWDNNKCVISHFDDISVEEAMNNMSSIGLNNVRTWLKPFNILSQGEQYRCAFARLLQQSKEEPDKVIIMDEFTSVLDRTNARCMSAATSKCIRKNNLNNNNKTSTFVLASANADIIRYLQPDVLILLGGDNDMRWIVNPNDLNDTKALFDVKAILDLPPFKVRKENNDKDEYKSIYPLTMFNDLKCRVTKDVTKEVRELKCRVTMDAHAKEISTILDVEEFKGECLTHIPCLQPSHLVGDFKIGVMVGPSGCGKTTSGERLFGRPCDVIWDKKRNIASHFKSIHDLKELFAAVDLPLNIGFSYFEYLSEGEQHRINIARQIVNDGVLIDEFTSYLDRECAVKVAKGVSDYIYKYNKRNIVFLCCKYDIISASNGLYPSWIFDVPNKKITHYVAPSQTYIASLKRQSINLYPKHQFIDICNLWNAVKIRLVLKPSSIHDFSPTFSKYHYMDASINCSAKCWSVWAYFSYLNDDKKQLKKSDKEEASDEDEDIDIIMMNDDAYYDENELELAGFISIMNHYGKSIVTTKNGSKVKFNYREHRTVILPAFQGLGFGSRIADCIGEYLCLHGFRLHSKTAHPRYGGYRNKKGLWLQSSRNGERLQRKQWKKDVDRILFGGHQKAIGPEKQYFIHLYKLHSDKERTEQTNKKLSTRVIVKKQYKKIIN